MGEVNLCCTCLGRGFVYSPGGKAPKLPCRCSTDSERWKLEFGAELFRLIGRVLADWREIADAAYIERGKHSAAEAAKAEVDELRAAEDWLLQNPL